LCFVKSWGIFVTLKALKLKKHEYYYHNAESVLVLIHKKKFLTWLKVSHEESKLDNMLLLNVFSLEPKPFPQLFCCELQNAIEKIVQSKHKLKFMLKKISITISLISKANNFEAIINKDGVTFPPKCWRGGEVFLENFLIMLLIIFGLSKLCKSPLQKRKEDPKLQPQSKFFLAPIRVYSCK
jgi:hypothetical protein